jgi:hypothetical protein
MGKKDKAKRKKEKHAAELREAFMARDVLPDAADRVNNSVRVAAEQGLHQIEVVTFPVKYCNDGGRSINCFDPDWPKSLEGYAKKAYTFYEKEAPSATRCTPRSSAIPMAFQAKQHCTSSGERSRLCRRWFAKKATPATKPMISEVREHAKYERPWPRPGVCSPSRRQWRIPATRLRSGSAGGRRGA